MAEIAREEAARAEAENPDAPEAPEAPETPPEPETAPEPPEQPQAPAQPAEQPQPPQTEAELESRQASWDRERDRHMRELKKRDEYRYSITELCPLCDGHGLFLTQLEEPDATMRRSAIVEMLGGQPERELKMNEAEEECATCAGWGMVAHPTKAQTQKETPCPSCGGQGWRLKVAPMPVFQATSPPPAAPQPFAGVGSNGLGPDQWGRAPGQPRYGEHPSIGGW